MSGTAWPDRVMVRRAKVLRWLLSQARDASYQATHAPVDARPYWSTKAEAFTALAHEFAQGRERG